MTKMSYRKLGKMFDVSKETARQDIKAVEKGLREGNPQYVIPILACLIKMHGVKAAKKYLKKRGLENLKIYIEAIEKKLNLPKNGKLKG